MCNTLVMFFSLLRKKQKKKNLFIHIPKVGGSTFVGLLKESVNISKHQKNQPTHLIENIGQTEIKHVDFRRIDRKFKSPDIFEDHQLEFYQKNYNVFMIVRNPVDRIQSEFNFQYHILNGKQGNTNAGIITRLRVLPHSLLDYASNAETQNYQCKFLLGRSIASADPVTENDFQRIIKTIDLLPIVCGTTDSYDSFLIDFQRVSGVDLKKGVLLRKKTPKKYRQVISAGLRKKILRFNKYDNRLFEYVKQKKPDESNVQKSDFYYDEKDEYIV